MTQTVKNLPAMRETWVRSLGGSRRSPGEGNGYTLQYSCLENSTGKGEFHGWRIYSLMDSQRVGHD